MLKKYRYLNLNVIVIALIVAAILYQVLPDPMPIHLDLHGHVDGYMAKPWGVFVLPVVMMVLWGVFEGVTMLSPRASREPGFDRAVGWVSVAVQVLLALTMLHLFSIALGWDVAMNNVVVSMAGFGLIVLGNFMGKLPSNASVGIRTKWTLSDPEVWWKTHRFSAGLFIVGGIITMAVGFTSGNYLILAVMIIGLSVASILYSAWLYRLGHKSEHQ